MSVTLTEVGHHFPGGPWLFQGVNARVSAGEVTALVGPSGSGKSTLLAIIAGWITPAEGNITIDDTADGHAAKINWVFQNPHGTAKRTAIDHVILPLLAQGLSIPHAQEQAEALMADFALEHVAQRPFATLSGGEGQRLMLARALASRPNLLLVDEPTAQLDQRTAHQVSATLTALHSRGVAVIIATHDTAVRDQCSRVIDLADYYSSTSENTSMTEDGAP